MAYETRLKPYCLGFKTFSKHLRKNFTRITKRSKIEPALVWTRRPDATETKMASKLAVYDTGYEDERFQQIVSRSFHCIICTNVIKDAVMCPQNEHLFCRTCITRYLMNSQKCPTCMEPLTVETLSQAPRGVKNLLSELKIRCEFYDRGCGKFIELGDLERHVADCGFAPAVCSNEGCELEVNKQDLLHHETAVCELRRVKCHSCNDIRIEMDTVKVNLAMVNEKLDRNEKKLSETLEKIENRKSVNNVVLNVELIRQQLNRGENNDEWEMHKTLKEITNQLERIIQKTPFDKEPSNETTSVISLKENLRQTICDYDQKSSRTENLRPTPSDYDQTSSPTENLRGTPSDYDQTSCPTENLRQTACDYDQTSSRIENLRPTPSDYDQTSSRTENLRPTICDYDQTNSRTENLRQTASDYDQKSSPTENLRQTTCDYDQTSSATENLRQTICDYDEKSSRTENLRPTPSNYDQKSSPTEYLRQTACDYNQTNGPTENLRPTTCDYDQTNSSTENLRPTSSDYDQTSSGTENLRPTICDYDQKSSRSENLRQTASDYDQTNSVNKSTRKTVVSGVIAKQGTKCGNAGKARNENLRETWNYGEESSQKEVSRPSLWQPCSLWNMREDDVRSPNKKNKKKNRSRLT